MWSRIVIIVFATLISTLQAGAAQLRPKSVAEFIANPAQLLQRYPGGGAGLISMIRDLAVSERATLPIIIGLLANASPDQVVAIGTGLGQAAEASLTLHPDYTAEIQEAIAASESQSAITAFAAVTGNVAIGATGNAAGLGTPLIHQKQLRKSRQP